MISSRSSSEVVQPPHGIGGELGLAADDLQLVRRPFWQPVQLVQRHQLGGGVQLLNRFIKAEGQPVHVLARERIDETGPHVGEQGEVQFTGLGLVVVHVLHQPVVFGGRRAQDFRHGGAGENDLAGQLRQQVQPRGLLGKKAQLHSYRSPEIVRTGKGGPRELTWGPATSQYFTGPRVRA